MTHSPSPLADAFGSLRSAAQRDAAAARTRLSGVWQALLLTLLATLFGRLERMALAWHPAEANANCEHPHCGRTLHRIALGLPAVSSSHHADAAALGLIADWIMRAFPARGMRAAPARPTSPRHATAMPARAPPFTALSASAPPPGAILARPFCYDIVSLYLILPRPRISPFANPHGPHSGRDRP